MTLARASWHCCAPMPTRSLNSSAVSPSSSAFLLFFPSFVGPVFHCSWIRGSVWQPPLLPLGWVLPPYKRKGGERRRGGGGEGSAALSHARKKGFTSSLRPQAPADYHRDTVGSFSPSAAFCVVDSFPPSFRSGKQALHGLVYWDSAKKTNKQTGAKNSSDPYRCSHEFWQNDVIVVRSCPARWSAVKISAFVRMYLSKFSDIQTTSFVLIWSCHCSQFYNISEY